MSVTLIQKSDYKTIVKLLSYLTFIVSFGGLYGQNILVKGKAHPSYAGKIIQAFFISDHITSTLQKESHDTIDSDGYFELPLQSSYTQPVFLKIENASAELYVQPDYVYGITVPEVDEAMDRKNDADLPLNIGIIGADSTELNALVIDYQLQYNQMFLTDEGKYLSRVMMFRRADSLQKTCDLRYTKIQNPYFKSYVEYSIASINASVSRGENYLIQKYILGKPIQYDHYEYMKFFNACFKGYLNAVASQRKGQSLYNIINNRADYDLLMNFVRGDKLLNNDSLRELVILQNLWDFHFSIDFAPEAIERIIAVLYDKTKIDEHKKIAGNMIAHFNKMQVGAPAPDFTALNRNNAHVSLATFKGRWIYLNFFSTTNVESLKEMPKIAAMRKKFGDKLVFVSVCLDDSLKSYKEYIRQNPKFDWNIWFNDQKSGEKTAKQNYFVTGTEAYFLINNFGYLAHSPALAPSKGIEYKLNVIFKVRQRNTKTGIR